MIDRKFIDRFNALQDMACGYCDEDEKTAEDFADRYKTKADMANEARYWLEMFMGTGRGIGCVAAEERFDDNPRVRQNWRNSVAKIKRFIATCEKEEQ